MAWRDLVAKPGAFLFYSAAVALNITFARAYATHAGPGTAAAFEYAMRCVGVPLAFLVSPVSHSLLPEIARLRSQWRLPQAFRLIDQTVAVAAIAALGSCGVALAFREPIVSLVFQRGSFTAQSTRLVADVFLGLGPALIGWSLLEIISRSLFALDRPWLPVCSALVPVATNIGVSLALHSREPRLLGLGASVGFFAAFGLVFALARANRRTWLTGISSAAGPAAE
jgi:putative peptidoglycan lipid II flippase